MERITLSLDADLAREFDALMAERGVRHGKLNLMAAELDQPHDHGSASGHSHVHLKPAR